MMTSQHETFKTLGARSVFFEAGGGDNFLRWLFCCWEFRCELIRKSQADTLHGSKFTSQEATKKNERSPRISRTWVHPGLGRQRYTKWERCVFTWHLRHLLAFNCIYLFIYPPLNYTWLLEVNWPYDPTLLSTNNYGSTRKFAPAKGVRWETPPIPNRLGSAW